MVRGMKQRVLGRVVGVFRTLVCILVDRTLQLQEQALNSGGCEFLTLLSTEG